MVAFRLPPQASRIALGDLEQQMLKEERAHAWKVRARVPDAHFSR